MTPLRQHAGIWIAVLGVIALLAIHAIVVYSAVSSMNVPVFIAAALAVLVLALHRRFLRRNR